MQPGAEIVLLEQTYSRNEKLRKELEEEQERERTELEQLSEQIRRLQQQKATKLRACVQKQEEQILATRKLTDSIVKQKAALLKQLADVATDVCVNKFYFC